MKKPYRVENILSSSPKFAITTQFEGETITLSTYANTNNLLDFYFSDFLFLGRYDNTKTLEQNLASTKEKFADTFDLWKQNNSKNIDVLYSALYTDYNPLENYDRKEEGGYTDEHHKGSKSATASKETTTPDLTTETTNRTKVKSSDFVYGFDSASASPTGYNETVPTEGTDKTTQTGTTSTTRTAEENYTTETDISDTVFDNDKRVFNSYRVHGNIGVTTPSDLIKGEFNIRLESLMRKLLFQFAHEYLFFADGLEVVE